MQVPNMAVLIEISIVCYIAFCENKLISFVICSQHLLFIYRHFIEKKYIFARDRGRKLRRNTYYEYRYLSY